MSRRIAGALFLVAAAMLYSTRYLAAAILSSTFTSQGSDLYQATMGYVGNGLWIWSAATALLGLVYLAWAEVEDRNDHQR